MPVHPTVFQGQPVWEISHGNARAVIAPQAGGRLLFWEIHQKPVIHWPENADWSKPAKIRGGNPLLFPFIARHFVDGVMGRWRDDSGTVREMPMHGFARDAVFRVSEPELEATPSLTHETSPAELVMELTASAETRDWYPFDFRFRVIHSLKDHQLTVRFETENRGSGLMPYQAGHHFYFALPADERRFWKLHLPPAHQAHQGPDGSIVPAGTSRREFSLDDPALQDCFHILDAPDHPPRPPKIAHPDGRWIEFQLDAQGLPWHALTTWTEKPESPFYCVEPWLGLPNAIHHRQGLRLLPPGTTDTASCTLLASGW